ncbi:MAG TPA: ferritin family protein [Gammaproteobacteria bacterium]|nr:ferritin family protein [Gammaproteobacteria bacterium]
MCEAYPHTAHMFDAMADEETGHRHRLLDLYCAKFGDRIPLIRCAGHVRWSARLCHWHSHRQRVNPCCRLTCTQQVAIRLLYISIYIKSLQFIIRVF